MTTPRRIWCCSYLASVLVHTAFFAILTLFLTAPVSYPVGDAIPVQLRVLGGGGGETAAFRRTLEKAPPRPARRPAGETRAAIEPPRPVAKTSPPPAPVSRDEPAPSIPETPPTPREAGQAEGETRALPPSASTKSSESPGDPTGGGGTAGAGILGGRSPGSGAGGPITSPMYRTNPKPEYPALARRMGHTGVVRLKVRVLGDGTVGGISIEKSSGSPVLDVAALDAVKEWTFVPGRWLGFPTPMWVMVPIHFSLDAE